VALRGAPRADFVMIVLDPGCCGVRPLAGPNILDRVPLRLAPRDADQPEKHAQRREQDRLRP